MNSTSEKVEDEFCQFYTHFKEFQQNPECRQYWDKCIEAVSDTELLSHIVFCNDIFGIPPIKTFLTYYKSYFIEITNDPKAVLDTYVKKSIGAFGGMVFKYALWYNEQKSVAVSMFEHFNVKTATYFIKNLGGNKNGGIISGKWQYEVTCKGSCLLNKLGKASNNSGCSKWATLK